MDRRLLLKVTTALAGWSLLPKWAVAESSTDIDEALKASGLIYLTPFRADGSYSRCRAELWFVQDGADVIVVTRRTSWRAVAVAKDLVRTRIWIGDLGVWTQTNGRYKELPAVEAEASVETDVDVQERVLVAYRKKYKAAWLFWSRRFRKGLQNGNRVMLRYRIL